MPPDTTVLFQSLADHEQCLTPLDYAPAGEPWFKAVSGRVPVLLSAPHACRHMRDGIEKMGEEFTAALAWYVAMRCDAHAIFTTCKSAEDPNWQPDGEYKAALRKLVTEQQIKLVIDIHGMTNRHHMGVALGTMKKRSVNDYDVVSPFLNHGFEKIEAAEIAEPLAFTEGVPLPAGEGAERHWQTLVVDHPSFTGGLKNHTVTRYVHEQLGVAAVQVEVASVNRIVHRLPTAGWPYEYRGNPIGIEKVAESLVDLVSSV